jgi:hypothetical protein
MTIDRRFGRIDWVALGRADQGAVARAGRRRGAASSRPRHPTRTRSATKRRASRNRGGRRAVERHPVTATPSAAKSRAARGSSDPGRVFAWQRVPRATYYTVRLYRGGVRVFEASVAGTRVRVPVSWVFERRRQRLLPGIYEWSVRPGYGARSRALYGDAVVRANLTVTRTLADAQR